MEKDECYTIIEINANFVQSMAIVFAISELENGSSLHKNLDYSH